MNNKTRSITYIERISDVIIIIAAFVLAYYSRFALIFWSEKFGLSLPFSGVELAPIRDYLPILFVSIPLYIFVLDTLGAYDRAKRATSLRLFKISVVSSIIVFFLLSGFLFIFKYNLSRVVVVMFCTIVGLSLAAERYVVRMILRTWRGSNRNVKNIVITGFDEQAKSIVKEIAEKPELGLRIVGFAFYEQSSRCEITSVMGNLPTACGIKEFENMLKTIAIDEVIFTDVRHNLNAVESMIALCADEGIKTSIAADLFSIGMVKSSVGYFGSVPLINYETPPGDKWELAIKRAIDVVGSAVLLITLSPLMLFIALGIKLMSPGPVIFKQKRVGLNGRLFSMYKFRSMRVGAEDELRELIDKNEMDGPVFKLTNDPRITPFGKFLRRFSLDELPQLYNVLRGDMSLVGPRPPVPREVEQYRRAQRRRLSMRPGLTCLWQVSGRNEIKDFETWLRLDLEYIDNWSLLMDFKILLKTLPAVIFGYGAR